MSPAWVATAISLVTVVTALFGWVLRSAWRLGKKTWQFIEDWEGQPAEYGRSARPGVIERLSKLEEVVAGISAQVHLDSGHSMKDVVTRTEEAVKELQRSVDSLTSRPGGKP